MNRGKQRPISQSDHTSIFLPVMQAKTGYYIGIDVGTGSARACVIDHNGDIVGLASENIGLWQPEQDYYVRL